MFLFCLLTAAFSAAQKPPLGSLPTEVFELYKQLHQYPELGQREVKTANLIKSELQKAGYSEFHSIAGLPTAVIAVLNTGKAGPVLALRAEMDARPQHEQTNLPYRSKVDSIMHSCGHDAHTALLLGAAKYLKQNQHLLSGKVVFLFQPAEETKGGADDIVNSGILKSLGVQRIYALHAVSGLPVGTLSVSPGAIMAGSNYFTIELKGKGSHAATPYEGNDLPLVTAELVQQLSLLPARKLSISERPCIISTTFIEVGRSGALNVLPSSAQFKGTVRAYENIDSSFKGAPSIKSLIKKCFDDYCASRNIQYTLKIDKGSPATINNQKLYSQLVPKLQARFTGRIDTTPFKGMFSEDFAYYTEAIPSLYFGWGIAKDAMGKENVHSDFFTIHPDSFPFGLELLITIALLENHAS